MFEPWLGRGPSSLAGKLVATVIVFHFVCLGWIFFRAEDFTMACLFILGLASGWGEGLQQAAPAMIALIGIGLVGQFTPAALFERTAIAFARLPAWGLGALTGIAVAVINALGPEGV